MGNLLAARQAPAQTASLLFDDLNLNSQGTIGGGRFLTTTHCVTDNGHVVVKIYYKRGERDGELGAHRDVLDNIRRVIDRSQQPNLMPYTYCVEAPRAAYLVRQFTATTIKERASTPPGLTAIEKKWFTFQMLSALSQCHFVGVRHGDVTLENFVMTSFRWAYLTDFASYKPVYLPVDDPSEFEYFFDTGDHKRCYLAPERFRDLGGRPNAPSAEANAELITEAMDVFAVGCCIAELFLDGEILLTYNELLAYRRNAFNMQERISRIQDRGIRDMVMNMLSLDPSARSRAADYLEQYSFPPVFHTLHTIFVHAINMTPDEKVHVIGVHLGRLLQELDEAIDHDGDGTVPSEFVSQSVLATRRSVSGLSVRMSLPPRGVDAIVEEDEEGGEQAQHSRDLLRRIEHLEDRLLNPQPPPVPSQAPKRLPRMERVQSAHSIHSGQPAPVDGPAPLANPEPLEGVVILATVVFASMRHLEWPSSRVLALNIILDLSHFTDDLVRVQRMVPYVMCLVGDSSPMVRARAIEVLAAVLAQVNSLVPGESALFDEYVLPDIVAEIEHEKDEIVLVACAQSLGTLAERSVLFLNMAQAQQQAREGIAGGRSDKDRLIVFDEKLDKLRTTVWSLFEFLFNSGRASVMRCLYDDISRLCTFLGWSMTLSNVLPVIVSPLNQFGDWQFRASFFESIPGVCMFLGRASTENNILPCIVEKLTDPEEHVVERVVECLAALCDVRIFSRTALIQIAEQVAPLVCHPNNWIRRNTVQLLAAIGCVLDRVDTFAFVVCVLEPFLVSRVVDVDEETLLANLRPPMSRQNFDMAVQVGVQTACGGSLNPESDRSLFEEAAMGRYLAQANSYMDSFASYSQAQFMKTSQRLMDDQRAIESLPQYAVKAESKPEFALGGEVFALQTTLNLQNPGAFEPDFVPPPSSVSMVLVPASEAEKGEGDESNADGRGHDDAFVFTGSNAAVVESMWRPRGVLLAQLHNHTKPVTRLCVSHNDKFFGSASDDGFVKVWTPEQIARRDTNRSPALSLSLASPITAMATAPHANAIACASDNGLLRLFDVEEVQAPSAPSSRGQFSALQENVQATRMRAARETNVGVDGTVLALSMFSSCLLSVTSKNVVRGWDVRSRRDAFHFPRCPPLHMGVVEDMIVDPHHDWVLLGTSLGFLVVYDLRFQVIGKAWRHPRRCPIQRLNHYHAAHGASSPLVLVSGRGSGTECCGVWDIGTGECLRSYQVLESAHAVPQDVMPLVDSDVYISGVVEFWRNQQVHQHLTPRANDAEYPHHTRALFHTPSSPFLLTGGTDRALRYWDLDNPIESYSVVSACADTSRLQYTSERSPTGRVIAERPLPDSVLSPVQSRAAPRASAKSSVVEEQVSTAHRGCITDVAVITHTDQSRLLLSAGRDGVVKVFK